MQNMKSCFALAKIINNGDEKCNEFSLYFVLFLDENEKKLLFGLDLGWMLVILTGGGSFLILFIISLVCVCRCYRRNKRKAKGTVPFNYFQEHCYILFLFRPNENIY